MSHSPILQELKKRFPEIFCMLLTSLATYTNLAPPMCIQKQASNTKSGSGKSKFGFIPNKDLVRMNPCTIVLETFQFFLVNLEFEQLSAVLSVCPNLASSAELNNFMELLTPMANGLVSQLGITSTALSQVITALSKYISSPYDPHRISSVGLFSQIVPLKPSGEISSVIMLHLNSALSDPNPLVRGFCIRGMAFVCSLTDRDIDKHSEMSLSALLKGIDDFNANCFINIPLESMRGLSRIVTALPTDKLESFQVNKLKRLMNVRHRLRKTGFQVSLAIRIRPFFENASSEIREAALLLFGDLCKTKLDEANKPTVSDALKEQIFANYFGLLLHLGEVDNQIIRVSRLFQRKDWNVSQATKFVSGI